MKTFLSACIALAMASPVFAAEIKGDAICPGTLQVRQEAVSVPTGFTVAGSDLPSILAGLTIFDGPPAELASLVPDEGGDSTSNVATWTLAQDPKRGLYVSCIYSGTRVQLQHKLPATITSCKVTYDNTSHIDGYPEIKSMTCK